MATLTFKLSNHPRMNRSFDMIQNILWIYLFLKFSILVVLLARLTYPREHKFQQTDCFMNGISCDVPFKLFAIGIHASCRDYRSLLCV